MTLEEYDSSANMMKNQDKQNMKEVVVQTWGNSQNCLFKSIKPNYIYIYIFTMIIIIINWIGYMFNSKTRFNCLITNAFFNRMKCIFNWFWNVRNIALLEVCFIEFNISLLKNKGISLH